MNERHLTPLIWSVEIPDPFHDDELKSLYIVGEARAGLPDDSVRRVLTYWMTRLNDSERET